MSVVFYTVLGCMVLVTVGIVLVSLSRLRTKEHPSCGGCGYDVTGTVGRTAICPECGRNFLEVGVLPPRRVGRSVMMTLGMLLVVTAVFLLMIGIASTMAAAARARAEQARAMAAVQQAQAAQAAVTESEEEATESEP